MRKVAWFQCLSCQLVLTWGQYIFPRLLNPDWSIEISRAPAVCKVLLYIKILSLCVPGLSSIAFWQKSNRRTLWPPKTTWVHRLPTNIQTLEIYDRFGNFSASLLSGVSTNFYNCKRFRRRIFELHVCENARESWEYDWKKLKFSGLPSASRWFFQLPNACVSHSTWTYSSYMSL